MSYSRVAAVTALVLAVAATVSAAILLLAGGGPPASDAAEAFARPGAAATMTVPRGSPTHPSVRSPPYRPTGAGSTARRCEPT
ncbi:MAG TPA: hypothetical protein VFM58_04105 [Solirubrobacteraceae bacterium]|nr:hypothetical protein [Solirubrobacteraceae bacterium]